MFFSNVVFLTKFLFRAYLLRYENNDSYAIKAIVNNMNHLLNINIINISIANYTNVITIKVHGKQFINRYFSRWFQFFSRNTK